MNIRSLCALVALSFPFTLQFQSVPAYADAPSANRVYEAKGVIKSFGPGRTFVNISHDAIPGYMGAMTMSFEPENSPQLVALAVGDRVHFAFVETPDARRLLKRIAKTK